MNALMNFVVSVLFRTATERKEFYFKITFRKKSINIRFVFSLVVSVIVNVINTHLSNWIGWLSCNVMKYIILIWHRYRWHFTLSANDSIEEKQEWIFICVTFKYNLRSDLMRLIRFHAPAHMLYEHFENNSKYLSSVSEVGWSTKRL